MSEFTINEDEETVILNFGGEGEVENAINVNNFTQVLRSKTFSHPGDNVLRVDFRHVPLPDASVGIVVSNRRAKSSDPVSG